MAEAVCGFQQVSEKPAHALAHLGHQFGGDDFQARRLPMACTADSLAARRRKTLLRRRSGRVLTALAGRAHLLGQLDEFLDHFLRGDGAVVISIERLSCNISLKTVRLCTRLRAERIFGPHP
jgi:hypothetical protein